MRRCTKVGIDVTWRCNIKCQHCYYLRHKNFRKPNDKPLEEACREVDSAIERGCDQIYLVGWGEPCIYPYIFELLEYAHNKNMSSSIITNGALPVGIFEKLYNEGLDHLHISTHGISKIADKIAQVGGTYEKQLRLKKWLKENNLPWRSNTTVQLDNYKILNQLIEENVKYGIYHFVLLNFLPHYQWKHHVRDMAVHPAELRPYYEEALDLLIDSGIYFTLRYFPYCHISPKYWKYIVNAFYVPFDPWEWEYGNYRKDNPKTSWRHANALRKNVQIGACDETWHCPAYIHCGGWNRAYNNGFGGVVKPIVEEIPDEYKENWNDAGSIHIMNPANLLSGEIRYKCD